MSIPMGWVALIALTSFAAGITITLIAAAFLAISPMAGHPGDTSPSDDT